MISLGAEGRLPQSCEEQPIRIGWSSTFRPPTLLNGLDLFD
jgi:hypothetical protein